MPFLRMRSGPTLLAVLLPLWSACGYQGQDQDQDTSLMDSQQPWQLAAQSLTFDEWCSGWQLDGCEVDLPEPTDPVRWQVGIDTFSEIVRSSSKFRMLRSDLELSSVQQLLQHLQAGPLLAIFNRLPWSELNLGYGEIKLQSADGGGETSHNGLVLNAEALARIRPLMEQNFDVQGIGFGSIQAGFHQALVRLQFAQPGLLNIYGRQHTIDEVPLAFLSPKPPAEQEPKPNLATLIQALADVVFESNFNWRERIELILSKRNLEFIAERFLPTLDPDQPLTPVLAHIVEQMKSVVMGGQRSSLVAAISTESGVRCDLHVVRVPILGRARIRLTLAQGFGVREMHRQGEGKVTLEIYGVSTNYGTFKAIEIDGSKARLRIGSLKFTIDLEGGEGGEGPGLERTECSA